MIATPAGTHPPAIFSIMDTARRGNYESGSDYVLEYGELRFTFNERDFTERVEQAACKLGFVDGALGDDEREDLVNLAVNGEVTDAHSDLGEHINECWGDLNGPSERSLVHWIRRLVFRGAWLDQRVMEGELEVVFDENTQLLRLRAAGPQLRAHRALTRAQLGPGRLPPLALGRGRLRQRVRAHGAAVRRRACRPAPAPRAWWPSGAPRAPRPPSAIDRRACRPPRSRGRRRRSAGAGAGRQRLERVDQDDRVPAALHAPLARAPRPARPPGPAPPVSGRSCRRHIERRRRAAPLRDLLGAHPGEHDLDARARSRPTAPLASSRRSEVAPAPGGPAIATREPRPSGASFSDFGASSFCDGKTGVSSANRGRSSAGSAVPPFTVSTLTSEGWRSLRRGRRAGPLTWSPARSSQRRIWAGETYTSSGDWPPAGATRTKPLPLARMSSTPVAISSSEISSSTTSGSSSMALSAIVVGRRRRAPAAASATPAPRRALERLLGGDLVRAVVGCGLDFLRRILRRVLRLVRASR